MNLFLTTYTPLIVSLGTLLIAVVTFAFYYMPALKKQTTLERARLFFEWNKWFDSEECANWIDKDDPNAKSLLALLIDSETDEEAREALRKVPIARKEAVLAFFEQLAIAVNTGLLKREAANYMFGYYAVMIRETKAFWSAGLENDESEWYWKVFNSFVDDMKDVQKEAQGTAFNPRSVKL